MQAEGMRAKRKMCRHIEAGSDLGEKDCTKEEQKVSRLLP